MIYKTLPPPLSIEDVISYHFYAHQFVSIFELSAQRVERHLGGQLSLRSVQLISQSFSKLLVLHNQLINYAIH